MWKNVGISDFSTLRVFAHSRTHEAQIICSQLHHNHRNSNSMKSEAWLCSREQNIFASTIIVAASVSTVHISVLIFDKWHQNYAEGELHHNDSWWVQGWSNDVFTVQLAVCIMVPLLATNSLFATWAATYFINSSTPLTDKDEAPPCFLPLDKALTVAWNNSG